MTPIGKTILESHKINQKHKEIQYSKIVPKVDRTRMTDEEKMKHSKDVLSNILKKPKISPEL